MASSAHWDSLTAWQKQTIRCTELVKHGGCEMRTEGDENEASPNRLNCLGSLHLVSVSLMSTACRPDMTFAVDWALSNNYLSWQKQNPLIIPMEGISRHKTDIKL